MFNGDHPFRGGTYRNVTTSLTEIDIRSGNARMVCFDFDVARNRKENSEHNPAEKHSN